MERSVCVCVWSHSAMHFVAYRQESRKRQEETRMKRQHAITQETACIRTPDSMHSQLLTVACQESYSAATTAGQHKCGRRGVWEKGSVGEGECGRRGVWEKGSVGEGECGRRGHRKRGAESNETW